jgi:hypothetical protein
LLQGPQVTVNYFTGLAIDGSADVSINSGTFTDNWGGSWGVGALLVQGSAVVQVVQSTFSVNGKPERASFGMYAGMQCRQPYRQIQS